MKETLSSREIIESFLVHFCTRNLNKSGCPISLKNIANAGSYLDPKFKSLPVAKNELARTRLYIAKTSTESNLDMKVSGNRLC